MTRGADPGDGGNELRSLVYELLDAHADTVELATGPGDETGWVAHLDYLRALHRRGKEILARSAAPEFGTPSSEARSDAMGSPRPRPRGSRMR
jgi:hypothetical protein